MFATGQSYQKSTNNINNIYYTTPSTVFAVIYYVVYHRNARLMTEFMKE